MFTKFKTTKRVLFLDPHAQQLPQFEMGEKIELILSPSLYWVKKLSLPVKYLRDAKKLLPSLFEDILPEGNYSYAVFKEGEAFLAFAYEDKKIIDELQKQNISISSISNVYFAQTELYSQAPVAINENEVLGVEDELLFIAPKMWYSDLSELKLADLKLSNKTIKLQQFSHIIDNSSLYKVGILLGLFIVILAAELFITSKKVQSVEEQKSEVFSNYSLYPTMMQNRAVLDEYKTTFEQQTKLRELIAIALKLRLTNDQKIQSIKYKMKKLTITLSNIDQRFSKAVLKSFEKETKQVTGAFKGENFVIEVTL